MRVEHKINIPGSTPSKTSLHRPHCSKIKSITAIAGKSLCGLGALGSILYVTAPVAVPALTALTAAIPTFSCVYYTSRDTQLTAPCTTACMNGIFMGLLTGGMIGAITTYHTWSYIVNCIYTPEAAALAAISGAGIIIAGGVLWKGSRML